MPAYTDANSDDDDGSGGRIGALRCSQCRTSHVLVYNERDRTHYACCNVCDTRRRFVDVVDTTTHEQLAVKN